MPFDFAKRSSNDWFYGDCFTIDPKKGAYAWEKLNANLMGLHVGMLPITLHKALLETLEERKTLERPR